LGRLGKISLFFAGSNSWATESQQHPVRQENGGRFAAEKNGGKSAANQRQNGGPSAAVLALIGAKNV
jgi:hypothetical protein